MSSYADVLRVSTESLNKYAENVLLRQKLRNPDVLHKPCLSLVSTDDLRLNSAQASRVGESGHQYLIEIPIGWNFILQAIFRRALASPSFMPWIDGASGSPTWALLSSGSIGRWWRGEEETLRATMESIQANRVTPDSGPSLPLIDPRTGENVQEASNSASKITLSPEREAACSWLVNRAMTFILNHEILHVLRGHVGLKQSLGLNRVCEMHGSSWTDMPNSMASWLLEADADEQSGRTLLDDLSSASWLSCLMLPNETEGHYFMVEGWHVLFASLLCMNTVLFLLNLTPGSPDESEFSPIPWWASVDGETHPSPMCRGVLWLGTSTALLGSLGLAWTKGRIDNGALVHLGHPIHQQVVDARCGVFGKSPPWLIGGNEYKNRVEKEVERAIQIHVPGWSDLKSRLKPHAYIEL